jgi:hypothetical protein
VPRLVVNDTETAQYMPGGTVNRYLCIEAKVRPLLNVGTVLVIFFQTEVANYEAGAIGRHVGCVFKSWDVLAGEQLYCVWADAKLQIQCRDTEIDAIIGTVLGPIL